jgi:hypothetical protein
VDLLYIHPVLVADLEQPLMDWTDPAIRQKVLTYSRQQTDAFAAFANVYVPFCRQLEFNRALVALKDTPGDFHAMEVGAEDARSAFRHYLEEWNQGRPFILFGHSEGAMDWLHVMETEFRDPDVARRLVAAYLIGIPIDPARLAATPHLKLAEGREDTGVIITYNTEAPEAAASLFTLPGGACINPLNWRTDAEPAEASLNLGAVFFDYSGTRTEPILELPAFCGAVVDPKRGALIVNLESPEAYSAPDIMGEGIYHMNDVYFFLRNLAQNAQDRIQAHSRNP